jgi:cation diffusion facilitator CzcD-associated flavoprotein CzcO
MTHLADLGAPVDVDVVIVGAGLSGIGAAHRLQAALPHLRLEILEARAELGGTWSLFRYPGVRSDSDMFTLAYPFAPWTEQEAIGSGPQILDYLRRTAAEHGLERRIRLRHKVVGADFDTAAARWTLTVETPDGQHQTTCRFLHVCSGYYSYEDPHDARIPGLDAFAGDVVHPQFWPEGLRYDGRRVVVIGSGARDYVDEHLTPSYDPWDQRLCAAPDGDFFTALRSGRAQVVTGTIDRVVPEGVRLTTGEIVPADIVVTATGLRVQVVGGIEPRVDGIPVPLGEQLVWAGAMVTGLPNFAFTVGYVNASWTLRSDLTARLVARVLAWMEERGYAVAEAEQEPGMTRHRLMGLDAGYLRRAEGQLPSQGDRDPWRMRQTYLSDSLAVRRLDLDRTLTGRAFRGSASNAG